MKKLLIALTLLFIPALAQAQCNGVFPNNTLCGNISGASAVPRPVANNVLTGVPGGTNGQIEYNNNGVFGGFTPGGDLTFANPNFTIVNGAVTNPKLATNSVASGNIQAAAATNAKLAVGTTGTVKGTTNGISTIDALASTILNAACVITPSTCNTLLGHYNVTWFGASCNGSTDDTTAIAAALTAAASGKLIFPAGTICKVKGSGSYIFTMTAPIIIDCQGAQIVLDATTPNTRGLFLFAVAAAGDRLPSRRLTRCLLNMNNVGAATITIDTTGTNTTETAEFEIDHVRDTANGSSSGTDASIFVNNSATNTNGGTFNVNFHDNVWFNGIYLNFAGDSIRIRDSILSGNKYGVYANLISGAAGLIIEGNNISAADTLLIDAAVGNTMILNNEFEQQIPTTDPNGALMNLRGGTGQLGLITLTGNSANALAGTGVTNVLRIGNVSQAYVESNSFVLGTGGPACIANATGALATFIGAANQWIGCATHITATVPVKYVQVGATP